MTVINMRELLYNTPVVLHGVVKGSSSDCGVYMVQFGEDYVLVREASMVKCAELDKGVAGYAGKEGGKKRRRFKKWDAVMYEGEPYIVESDEEEDCAVKLRGFKYHVHADFLLLLMAAEAVHEKVAEEIAQDGKEGRNE